MKIKMISSEEKEEWLKETYEYLQKLKECNYEDVRLDYIMLYELHEKEHKEIERLNNIIFKVHKMIYDNYGVLDKYEIDILDDILTGKELKEGE